MNLALALLLAGAVPTADHPNTNLDFSTGATTGWEGDGFCIAPASGRGPSLACGVSSCDRDTPGRTATLHRLVTVPARGGVIRFSAMAVRRKNASADKNLDVVLFAAGRKIIPKQVRTASGWVPANAILPGDRGRPREYLFDVSNHAGQQLRLAIIDEDKRPGCHVFASGFRLQAGDEFEARDFLEFMVKLTGEHKLSPVAQFPGKHFLAIYNTDDEFARLRLGNCELFYDLFYAHFTEKGFRLREPSSKLMVAIFDSQAGFNAYIGQQMPAGVTGMYHPKSNRLVVYDFGTNEAFVAQKRAAEANGKRIGSQLDRTRFLETVQRQAREFRSGTNIGTVMHESAHQLSFNSGMLNREGDVPVWLAEGLATYCEPTDGGVWTGIGEPNPERIHTLVDPRHIGKGRIALRDLIGSDDWLRGKNGAQTALLGYAQSWALFRMLMEERPQQLRTYLGLIWSRKGPEFRVDDFGRAFGADLDRLELRYVQYMKDLIEQHAKPGK